MPAQLRPQLHVIALPLHRSQVVSACSLEADIATFADGHDAVIGERGVSLSGGQRARLGLARACYLDADVYVLDDPLSAVDRCGGELSGSVTALGC